MNGVLLVFITGISGHNCKRDDQLLLFKHEVPLSLVPESQTKPLL